MKRIVMTLFALMLMPFMALATTLSDGLVAHYKFDGNAKDSSGNANDGVVHGAMLTTDRFGNEGKAVYLGWGNWIQVADSESLRSCTQNITIALWAKVDGRESGWPWNTINYVTKGAYGSHGEKTRQFGLAEVYGDDGDYIAMNDPVNGLVNDYIWTDYSGTLKAGVWRQVVMTYNGACAKTYINGELVASSNVVTTVGVSFGDLYIGKDLDGGGTEYCNAAIDDVRIYNRALSTDEVKLLYAQILYVNGTTGSDENCGTSPSAAKKTIQAAIDASVDGDTILVAPGTYARFNAQYKQITISSASVDRGAVVVNGSKSDHYVSLGAVKDREEVCGTKYATLIGFSIVECGVFGGKLSKCIVRDDSATPGAALVAFCLEVDECLICDNRGSYDYATVGWCQMSNCTIVNNIGRSCWDCNLYNCIVYGHDQDMYLANCYNCLAEVQKGVASGNIVGGPKFIDAANCDYRLAADSPCIDAGNNSYVSSNTDLDGKARIVNGTVDIGCYEYVGGVEPIVYRTVTFDGNGGVASAESRSVKNGAAVGELPTATREGYDFLGWFMSPKGGTKVSEATVVTADVTWYAHWQEQVVEPTIFTVQFNANGGTCTRTSVEVEDGAAVGTLPTARRTGYDFLGWFTSPNGGMQVSASTVVTEDATWYAHWQEQSEDPIVPPVDPGEDDEPMDASIANTYDGVIVDADGLPMGYITVKAAKASGKGDAKVSKVTATIQMVGETKKVTVKANVVVAEATMTQVAADGRVLDLTFSRYGIWGTFDDYEIDGVRNLLLSTAKSDKGTDAKIAAESACAALKGNYVMAYGDENGYNGLSVSIMAKGKVKVSGKLSNGTSVSTASQLIVGEDYSVIPVIYTKKDTSLAFNIYFANDGSEAEVFGYYDAVISSVSGLGSGLSFNLGDTIYDLFEDYMLLDEFLPYEVSVEPKGKKWVVAGGAAAGKIKVVDGEVVDTKDSENPSGLKLTFNAKAGTFSGSFKVYALDSKGKLKTFTATVSGVVVDGLGYGVATIKRLGSVAVTIE